MAGACSREPDRLVVSGKCEEGEGLDVRVSGQEVGVVPVLVVGQGVAVTADNTQ